MNVITSFPHPVREIENTWITLADGTRLAARLWLPEDAEKNPVPALLEYLPYRKDDFTTQRDARQHPYFAGHGYASIRVDMRGTGDSDGILFDEYLKQEQDDALEVLAWIAEQPWCTGNVGIIGISWGGFNGLQIAARRPPQLKAVISLCSTDDRYADDVHYVGGCLLANSQLTWASTMLAGNARPPDPRFVGDRWREMWLDRMERTPPYVEAWMQHQRRDAFWKHGSVCENFADITCPVYMVGGWADGYTNSIYRTLEGLSSPKKGLVGPWAHAYPEAALPGPAIGFLQEALRWWDYWLKGIDTGIMDEPMIRTWMQDSVPPLPHYDHRPGRWVSDPSWPSPNVASHSYYLNDGSLSEKPGAEARLSVASVQANGLDAGTWCPYGVPGDMPPDQRTEDSLSLTFTSAPLDATMEIMGYPEVSLTVTADRPQAFIAIRLCDIAPDGASTLVTRGLLNLTHRDSHEFPEPLEPGQPYAITVRLNAIAHSLPAGHRWRVAISPTYWPWAWPSPEPVTLTVFAGPGARLDLPVRSPSEADNALPDFPPAEAAAPVQDEALRPATRRRELHRDIIRNEYKLVNAGDFGSRRLLGSGLEYGSTREDTYTLVEGDPLSAHLRCNRTATVGRGDWQTRVESSSTLSADAKNFHLSNVLEAYDGNVRVFSKTWNLVVPRDEV